VEERTSNWLLHLDSMMNVLPLFAVIGHSNYAKMLCCWLQLIFAVYKRGIAQNITQLE
jgi:hypothetical protein